MYQDPNKQNPEHHTLSFSVGAACVAFRKLVESCAGRFQHYKGVVYQVNVTQPLTMNTETGEVYVNYGYAPRQPLLDSVELGHEVGFSRPLEMFTSTVFESSLGHTKPVPRFQAIPVDRPTGASDFISGVLDNLGKQIAGVDGRRLADMAIGAFDKARAKASGGDKVYTREDLDAAVAKVREEYKDHVSGTVHCEALQRADNWESSAAQIHRNYEFVQGLIVQIGKKWCGDGIYIQDDGGRADSPLLLKIPELIDQKFNDHAKVVHDLNQEAWAIRRESHDKVAKLEERIKNAASWASDLPHLLFVTGVIPYGAPYDKLENTLRESVPLVFGHPFNNAAAVNRDLDSQDGRVEASAPAIGEDLQQAINVGSGTDPAEIVERVQDPMPVCGQPYQGPEVGRSVEDGTY